MGGSGTDVCLGRGRVCCAKPALQRRCISVWEATPERPIEHTAEPDDKLEIAGHYEGR
jgi:hypothetical protein